MAGDDGGLSSGFGGDGATPAAGGAIDGPAGAGSESPGIVGGAGGDEGAVGHDGGALATSGAGGSGGAPRGGAAGAGGTSLGGAGSGGTSLGGASGGSAGGGGASAGSGGTSGARSLIGNGDFRDGGEGWNVMPTGGPATIKTDGGKLCVEAGEKTTQIVIGWPYAPYSPITLEPGVAYTFSLRAVGTQTVSLIAKLGEVSSPYTPYAALIIDTSGSWQSFSKSFSLNSGSQTVGVAVDFVLQPLAAVCIDDVIVTSP